jgi:hypothetical protein
VVRDSPTNASTAPVLDVARKMSGRATAVPIIRDLVTAAPKVRHLPTLTKITHADNSMARHRAAIVLRRVPTKVVAIGSRMAHPAATVRLEIWMRVVADVGGQMAHPVETGLQVIATRVAAAGAPIGPPAVMARRLTPKQCGDTGRPMARLGPMVHLLAMDRQVHVVTEPKVRRTRPVRMRPTRPVALTTNRIVNRKRPFEFSLVSTRSRVSGPSQPGTGLLFFSGVQRAILAVPPALPACSGICCRSYCPYLYCNWGFSALKLYPQLRQATFPCIFWHGLISPLFDVRPSTLWRSRSA